MDDEESLSEENYMSCKNCFSLFLSLGDEEVMGGLCVFFYFNLFFVEDVGL